jgi:putative transposase
MMVATKQLAQDIGDVQQACKTLGVPRPSFYRYLQSKLGAKEKPPRSSPLALTETERSKVLSVLSSERFVDKAPHEIHAVLLDEGQYYCSVRTMYRILEDEGAVQERRKQRRKGNYVKPELLATIPNQVWSWDITRLKGPRTWSYYYLYVILDIFSRYVVGWMVADREAAALAKSLIDITCKRQNILKDQLTLHADRGPSMKSKPVAFLLSDLGVTKTHNRPYTSNDNPYSESQFKTLKYCPQFPDRFGSIQDAKQFCRVFFQWYNHEHRHSGISMLTPETVHYGMAEQVLEHRGEVLKTAFERNPARFKYRMPSAGQLPEAAWINKPKQENLKKEGGGAL